MNSQLEDPRHPWIRLTTAARRTPAEPTSAAPYGFATRVAALALGREPEGVSLFDLFALRALGIACLLAIGSIALNYGEFSRRLSGGGAGGPAGDDALLSGSDAVAVVLALAD